MWFLPTWDIFAKSLTTWLGIRTLEKAGGGPVKKLYQSFAGIPSAKAELITYNRDQRSEAISLLSSSEAVMLNAMNLTFRSKQKELLEKLDRVVNKLSDLQDSIRYTHPARGQESIDNLKRLGYVDLLVCCDSFDINLIASNCLEFVEEDKWEDAKTRAEGVSAACRRANDLLNVRSFIASSEDPRRVLNVLGERNPEAYNRIGGVIKLVSFAEELKSPGWLRRKKYYKELGAKCMNVAHNLIKNGRHVLSFIDFHSEFERKELLKVTENDLEKALIILAAEGQIGGLIQGVVVLESEDASRRRVVDMVLHEPAIQKDGLGIGELIEKTGWPSAYVSQVLEKFEDEGAAHKIVDAASGIRWYFPTLASKSKGASLA
jgi:hypothetical protein